MRPRLVLFGDSITEQSFEPGGWGAALADRFARQVRTRVALPRACSVPLWLAAPPPTPTPTGRRGLTLA
jgi:hypothetical protein